MVSIESGSGFYQVPGSFTRFLVRAGDLCVPVPTLTYYLIKVERPANAKPWAVALGTRVDSKEISTHQSSMNEQQEVSRGSK